MTLSYLTPFARDDPIMDPWGLVSTDFTWYNFNLGCREKERERRRWVRNRKRERELHNRSWLDKGRHNEGPLHTRDTASLIILTRVALFKKAVNTEARCEESEEWKGALHLPHMCTPTISSMRLEHAVPKKTEKKKKKTEGNTKITSLFGAAVGRLCWKKLNREKPLHLLCNGVQWLMKDRTNFKKARGKKPFFLLSYQLLDLK